LSSDIDALPISCVPISRRDLEYFKKCKVIVKCAVGIKNIDLEAATKKESMLQMYYTIA